MLFQRINCEENNPAGLLELNVMLLIIINSVEVLVLLLCCTRWKIINRQPHVLFCFILNMHHQQLVRLWVF